ncbi:MAG: hypothetical protein AB1938_29075 [Myxococcota bacterium]
MRANKAWWFVLVALAGAQAAAGKPAKAKRSEAEVRTRVEAVLRQPRPAVMTEAPGVAHARELKPLGPSVLPALASFLNDSELAWEAMTAMVAFDEEQAFPLLLGAIPNVRDDVHALTFARAVRRLDGKAPVTFRPELRLAAIRSLEQGVSRATPDACAVLAATGDERDVPLLARLAEYEHKVPQHRDSIRHAALVALVRLGSEPHRQNLIQQLEAPVPNPMTFERAIALQDLFRRIPVTQDVRLAPQLCRHLSDPGLDMGDTGIWPGGDAAQALDRLMRAPKAGSLAEWKRWCAGGVLPGAEPEPEAPFELRRLGRDAAVEREAQGPSVAQRIAKLVVSKDTSAHAFMLEAIREKLDAEEARALAGRPRGVRKLAG